MGLSKVRNLLETIRHLAPVLNDEEISDIGNVLLRATDRLLQEAGEQIE
jgi:hypothetical protein